MQPKGIEKKLETILFLEIGCLNSNQNNWKFTDGHGTEPSFNKDEISPSIKTNTKLFTS